MTYPGQANAPDHLATHLGDVAQFECAFLEVLLWRDVVYGRLHINQFSWRSYVI